MTGIGIVSLSSGKAALVIGVKPAKAGVPALTENSVGLLVGYIYGMVIALEPTLAKIPENKEIVGMLVSLLAVNKNA